MNEYDAKSIRILTKEEVDENFIWTRLEALDAQYPMVAREAIERLLVAASTIGIDFDQIQSRYLDNKTGAVIERAEEFLEAYNELVYEATPGRPGE